MKNRKKENNKEVLPGRRLIDCLIHQGELISPKSIGEVNEKWLSAASKVLMESVRKAQVFEISNISDYYYTYNDQEEWNLYADFPSVTAPFDYTWFEFKGPSVIMSRECGTQKITGPIPTFGVLILSKELPDEKFITNGTGQTCFVFMRPGGSDQVLGPCCTAMYLVDETGKPTPWEKAGNKVILASLLDSSGRALQTVDELSDLFTIVHPALLALTFLNCKNTQVVKRSPDQRLSALDVKKGKKPLVYFYTLEIEQVKQVIACNKGEEGGLKKALHVARGHFKDYREHGLFGRTKGLFWWGPSIRGTESAGVVTKDYSIGKMKPANENLGRYFSKKEVSNAS